jgi:uncharacterized membrane protein YgdD (TMEM256/DUF423 family)
MQQRNLAIARSVASFDLHQVAAPSSEGQRAARVTLEIMNWTAVAAVLLALAVAFGAFGAHGLRGRIDEYSMSVYERAVLYHFLHALGLLIVSQMPRVPAAVGWLLLAGVVLFSGSLYLLAITGVRTLGAVTPFGGIAFIAAWVVLAWSAMKKS